MVYIVLFPNTAVEVAQKLAASFPKTDVEIGVISSLVSYDKISYGSNLYCRSCEQAAERSACRPLSSCSPA